MDGMWILKIDEGERWESEDKFETLEEAIECANKVLTKYNESTDEQKALQKREMEDMFDFYPEDSKNINSFFVGQLEMATASIDVEYILEYMGDMMYDEYGDIAEDYLTHIPDENKKELQDLIFGWMSKHDYLPSFYKIVNESEEQVEENI